MLSLLLWLIFGYIGYKFIGVKNIFFEIICAACGPISFFSGILYKIYKTIKLYKNTQ